MKNTGQSISRDEDGSYIFDGVTFKDNSPVPIIEESQKLEVARILVTRHHKKVVIRDTPVTIKEVRKKYGTLFVYEQK